MLSIPYPVKNCEFCGVQLECEPYVMCKKTLYFYKECTCEGAALSRKKLEDDRRSESILEEFNTIIKLAGGIHVGRYASMTFADWDLRRNKDAKAHYDFVHKFIAEMTLNNNLLWLYGNYGCGKTHLAIAAVYKIVYDSCVKCIEDRENKKYASPIRAFYAEWGIHCSTVQQSWDKQSDEKEGELWGRMMKSKLLVIDDIDKRMPSEWALGKLYEVVNHRYMHQLPTIITANHSLGDLGAEWASRGGYVSDIGGAIISRLVGQLWGQRQVTGGDQRLKR